MPLSFLIQIIPKVFATSSAFTLSYPNFATATSPASFVESFYVWALGISASLAVIMIVYGGVKYAVSPGNAGAQSEARDIIINAVWGIVLLAGAYLILNTINPSLTTLRNPGGLQVITAPTSTSPGGSGGGGKIITSSQLTNSQAVTLFNRFGISISSSGNCSDPNNSSCTSLEGFPKAAACKLIEMQANGASDIRITGGTEVGHKEHGSGIPVVDLGFSNFVSQTDQYIVRRTGKTVDQILANPNNFSNRYLGNDSNSYVFETAGTGKHWHVRLQLKNDPRGFDVNSFSADTSEWYYCQDK